MNKEFDTLENLNSDKVQLIYESPDGGETVYARLPGSTERVKISESKHVQMIKKDADERELWEAIRQETKTNAALQEAMNRVIVLYKLIKSV